MFRSAFSKLVPAKWSGLPFLAMHQKLSLTAVPITVADVMADRKCWRGNLIPQHDSSCPVEKPVDAQFACAFAWVHLDAYFDKSYVYDGDRSRLITRAENAYTSVLEEASKEPSKYLDYAALCAKQIGQFLEKAPSLAVEGIDHLVLLKKDFEALVSRASTFTPTLE